MRPDSLRAVNTEASCPIEGATIRIESSGFADGPAQALRDYLLMHGVGELVMVQHPLTPEGPSDHIVTTWKDGRIAGRRRIRLPHRPPVTYPLDLVVRAPVRRYDAWFGFNSLAVLRGLIAQRRGHAARVVQWCVDFVPDRFDGGIATRAYDALDRLACTHADARFELAEAGRDGRDARHGLDPSRIAPVSIVPMGAWLDRVPITAAEPGSTWRPIYMGHLVERQGVAAFMDALAILVRDGQPIDAHVVGAGPLGDDLRAQADRLRIADHVRFHGFVEDHRDVEAILASCTAGCAPYDTRDDSFTRFADPGKLKAYLAAGLPIVTTPVAPIAPDLAAYAGAEIAEFTPKSIALAIERVHADREQWSRRRADALQFARRFDWSEILCDAMSAIGLTTTGHPGAPGRST